MTNIIEKLKEVTFSVFPITLIVLCLSWFFIAIPAAYLWRFLIGAILVIFGLTLFLIGVEKAVTPLGHLTGTTLAKSNRLSIVLLGGILVGFFVSIAEPGLFVLANQVNSVTLGKMPAITILLSVSLGLAILLSSGFVRIFYNIPLHYMLLGLYSIVGALSLATSKEFLAIAFDASGATTGILAVPFILSLSSGVSRLKKDSQRAETDSFGLVSIASTGAIIAVMCLDIFSKTTQYDAHIDLAAKDTTHILEPFLSHFLYDFKDSLLALSPLVILLLVCHKHLFHLPKKKTYRMFVGFLYAFLGILLFFSGVNSGFMDIGLLIGEQLILKGNAALIIVIGFLIGFITILAEPAVYVLTHQIEEVTSGYVKRGAVLISLALGVGLAVALSVIRILIPSIQLWHYLLPGYILCLALMFVTPKLFVGIAFDAGGVATGPITATFILAFIQGAAFTFERADLMIDGFGMIAMVAMMPILTLEILGILFHYKTKKARRT